MGDGVRSRTHRREQEESCFVRWSLLDFSSSWIIRSLKSVTRFKRIDYRVTLRTPTVRRTLDGFNRRLTCLTLTGTLFLLVCTSLLLNYQQFGGI